MLFKVMFKAPGIQGNPFQNIIYRKDEEAEFNGHT